MTDVDIIAELQRPLDAISERKFRGVVALLEQARDQPAAQALLDRMRPRLRRVRPPRRPSLRRLFYLPVEDLLESGEFPVEADRIGRLAMKLAWDFLIGDANPEWSAIQADFPAAANSRDKLEELGKRLWPHAGARLNQALSSDGDRDARRRLVGVRTEFVPELERLALLERLGGEVQAIKSQLPPKPVRTLAPDHLLAIRDFLQHNSSGEADRAFALLLAIGARMAVPAELIRHVALMPLGLLKPDHLNVIERLQGTALADIDRAARRAEEAPAEDTVGRANLAKELVQAISAAQDGFAMGGRMSKELTRLRGSAEKAVTNVVADAGAKVASTVEIGPSAPLEAHVDAENNLLALRKCQSFAPAVGMEGKVNEALHSIASAVRERAAGLFKGLAGGSAEANEHGTPEAQVYWAVRMLELSGNADEADKLRRDGMALIARVRR